MVGNKIDLDNERKVKEEDAKFYADLHNYIFAEVSALTGDGIEDLFYNKLTNKIKAQFLNEEKPSKDQEEENLKFHLKGNNKKNIQKRKCCCWK